MIKEAAQYDREENDEYHDKNSYKILKVISGFSLRGFVEASGEFS